jgi:hypothetical protein
VFFDSFFSFREMASSSDDLLRICDPLAYFSQFLREGVYPDGRRVRDFLPISVQLSVISRCRETRGSSLVRQGGSSVLSRVVPHLALAASLESRIQFHIDGSDLLSQVLLSDPGTFFVLAECDRSLHGGFGEDRQAQWLLLSSFCSDERRANHVDLPRACHGPS